MREPGMPKRLPIAAEKGEAKPKNPDYYPTPAEIPAELKGITAKEVVLTAPKIEQQVMKLIRKNRNIITYSGETHFMLPVEGQAGREHPLCALGTTGCSDAHGGECTFCDYGHDENMDKKAVVAGLPAQVERSFEIIDKHNEGYEDGIANITGIGSFLDKREIPLRVREMVYQKIADRIKSGKFPKGYTFHTEARPKYMTTEVLDHLVEFFAKQGIIVGKDLDVHIGYGLESLDPFVLAACMGKEVPEGFTENLHAASKHGIKITGHALVKPPFLTEKEAINDTVFTVRKAFKDRLADMMLVMTMNKRDATLVGELAERKQYELPKIWSVVEIMRQLGPEMCKKTKFLGFSIAREAIEKGAETVSGCDGCSDSIVPKILAFNSKPEQWQEIMDTADKTNCTCKKEWTKRMDEVPTLTLPERVAHGLDPIARTYTKKSFRDWEKEVAASKK